MRFMARRVLSGEWITRDLKLTSPEVNRVLSGPFTISGTTDPEFNRYVWNDGLRPAEDWATWVYAVSDDGDRIVAATLVVPPTAYEDATRLTCAGVSAYPSGYIYTGARLWGPQAAQPAKKNSAGTVIRAAIPAIPRPDPITIFRDHWQWIQDQQFSDLAVTVTGDLTTGGKVFVGNNAEPYRLRKWEAPDLGEQMSTLAEQTPFDFVEENVWANDAHTEVSHEVRVGYPRLGRRRDELRFVLGENIAVMPSMQTLGGRANYLIGLGKGEAGPSMVYQTSSNEDGRLRRTRIVTNKTLSDVEMTKRLAIYQQALTESLDITAIAIVDHPNARVSDLQLGDDIRVQFDHPQYGPVDTYVRVLSILTADNEEQAILTTSLSAFFMYLPADVEDVS